MRIKKFLMPTLLFGALNANAANLIIEMEQMPHSDAGMGVSKGMTRGVCKIYDDGKAVVEFRAYDAEATTYSDGKTEVVAKNEQAVLSSTATFKINKKQLADLIDKAKAYDETEAGAVQANSAIYTYKNKKKVKLAYFQTIGGYQGEGINDIIQKTATIMCNQHGLSVLNNRSLNGMSMNSPW